MGVVIHRGTSPSNAVEETVAEGIISSNRASITLIPPVLESRYLPYEKVLLSEADVLNLFKGEEFTKLYKND